MDLKYFMNHKLGTYRGEEASDRNRGQRIQNILRVIKRAPGPASVQFVGQPETLQLFDVSNTS